MHQLAVRFSRHACPVEHTNTAADILTHRCADVHLYSDANIHSNGSADGSADGTAYCCADTETNVWELQRWHQE
jgi:hypothetical protein